jgi:nucleoside phosphorylase
MRAPGPIATATKLDRLFLHFFDTHFIADKGRAAESDAFVREMRLATRIAVACAHTVFVPAASYYESPLCRQILGEVEELLDFGHIALSGSAINIEEYVRERQDEDFYRKGSLQHQWYRVEYTSTAELTYMQRQRSATRDVTEHWKQGVADDSLMRKLRDATDVPLIGMEQRLERVPQELGGLAFIPEHVYEILDLSNSSDLVASRIRNVINEGYFKSYVDDLQAGVMIDLRHLASPFAIPSRNPDLSYIKVLRFVQAQGRVAELLTCSPGDLVRIGNEPTWLAATQLAVNEPVAAGLAAVSDRSQSTFFTTYKMNDISPVSLSPEASAKTTVLCVAAAAIELEVVRLRLTKEFGPEKMVHLDPQKTQFGFEFTDRRTGAVWYLVGQAFQGAVDAGVLSAHLNHLLHPSVALMVGMCMGLPGKGLSPGTVVVPNEVYGFDHRRLTEDGERFRPHGGETDNGPYVVARLLSERQTDYKVVADKGLASASTKIEDVSTELVASIGRAFPDVVAFDMEGYGFYRALKRNNCLWIKAVADNGEYQGDTPEAREEKKKMQSAVTGHAIEFALQVISAWSQAEPVR